jgi:hypothetical protein
LAFFEQNNLDLEKEMDTRIRADVYFYSHHYPNLFKENEWAIISKEIKYNNRLVNDYGITMLGVSPQ